ncbi:ABC transporter permease [Paenibacillus sp. GCM10027627]|uniref:ABC transporter permease n=1 Tax=unclassified Paenibacillus TaxID=185978 RepID=UPI0036398C34
MVDFLQLLRNENMKIYRLPRLFIFLGIIFVLVLGISITTYYVADKGSLDMWEMSDISSLVLTMLVTIFSVIVAAGTVAEEFSTGTIKLLLIRPWSRSKILLSKYIACLLFSLLLTLFLLASILLVNGILFGGWNVVKHLGDETTIPGFEYILKFYGLYFLSSIITVTISFMLSTIFRSNALAIGIALFMELIMNNVLMLLQLIEKKWVDYLIFSHLSLIQYVSGSSINGYTLGFSLAVLGVYYVIFIAVTWLIFTKRDVAT